MHDSTLIAKIKSKYSLENINEILETFKGKKILVIGDTIIDEYHFTIPKGRATKDPILSVDYISHESYAGGALAIANHVSNFVSNVTLITLIGDKDDRKDFIKGALNRNISPVLFVKKNAPTTVKRRFLNVIHGEKLFKVEYMDDSPLNGDLENEILDFLRDELKKFDMVIIGDFGHGLITEKMARLFEEKSKYLAINVQSNSANLCFNFITKYRTANFLTMDLPELWYAVSDRFSELPVLAEKLHARAGFSKFLITLGKDGVDYFNEGTQTFFPAFITKPHDTLGAGDAVLAVTSLFAYTGYEELIPFIANCVGGIAVSYIGNKEFVNRENLIGFIEQVYDGEKILN